LSDKSVKDALTPFTKLVVDVSDRSDRKAMGILQEMDVKGLPTLVFLDGEGNETARLIGPQPAAKIIAAAKAAQGAN
jgi:thiol:disulfide interchange protein